MPSVRAEQQDGPQLAAQLPQTSSEDQLPDTAPLPLHCHHHLRPRLPLQLRQQAVAGVVGGRGEGCEAVQGRRVHLGRRAG